jgi:diaminopimelate epimerase
MLVKFWKMNGAGNDFICLDNRLRHLRLTKAERARLCSRQFGIGADGLLIMERPKSKETDFRMRYYNADGGEAEMCGNGARCFARFARRIGGTRVSRVEFSTKAVVVAAKFLDGKQVLVELTAPGDVRLNQKVETSRGALTVHCLNTGVPHAVVFVDDVEKIDVKKFGAELRWHEKFQPKGTNVNFAQILAPGKIKVRTYERGVEDETLACGTGVTATALAAAAAHGFQSPVSVSVRSKARLRVLFTVSGGGFEKVKLQGPVEFTFTGEIDV